MAIPYPALHSQSEFHLLVTGGSQGARVMSMVVPEAIALLSDDIKARLRITHQARGDDLETAKALYDRAGVHVDIRAFFDDLPMRMANAHLVIGRAGAPPLPSLR
jgi:UDP-N-acetylglucosamine--N-acetylmuramyl-(pentapeptide) pyrophosphoryl-undecaprenol N-acetylglucosamine transferase